VNTLDVLLLILSLILGILALTTYIRLKALAKKHKLQAETTKEQFYEIVHELRAPLTAVKDAAILLNDMPGKLTQEDQKKILALIKSECIKLLDQVSSFLDASKVMSNKLTIQKTPNDLKNLLQEKVLIYSPQAQSAGLEITSDLDLQIPLVMYDQKYLNQVMNNLISNSLKYTPRGGKITVSAKTVNNTIIVSVFDNGFGVPDEKQQQLFSKFASLNTQNPAMGSSGLGLYVVKGIIEAHGGKVTVETQEGRGYKVSFILPIQAAPASLSQPVSEKNP
jgi:signal transduction histidine kinase